MTLTSMTNEVFHADAVIVTIPLGCFQRGGIQFTPPLPPRVQAAISDLGFGVNERLFIRFSTAWWLCHNPDESDTLRLERYLFSPQLAEKSGMPSGCMTFYSLARTHNPQPLIAIFVVTKLRAYLVSQPKEDVKNLLQTYYVSLLPNYDPQNSAHQIVDVDCSAWSRDVFSGFGSYSFVPAGSNSGDMNMNIMPERILPAGERGGLWFAGEHTTDTTPMTMVGRAEWDEITYDAVSTATSHKAKVGLLQFLPTKPANPAD
jgi:Flavin containing amine oxidoreductase